MPMFRKRPVVIEAYLIPRGGFAQDKIADVIAEWCGGCIVGAIEGPVSAIKIPTLEGTMLASPGDWVIRGVSGEFYPCKPDIFTATYEAA